jgi:hypothetical protein
MVKEEIVKRILERGNEEKTKKRRVFSITSFTRF